MQKKKILFVNNNLEVGGVQTSLLNLLNEIVKNHSEEYEVSLFLFCNSESVSEQQLAKIPAKVDVRYANGKLLGLGMSQNKLMNYDRKLGVIRGLCAAYARKFSNALPIRFLQTGWQLKPQNGEEYDIAVSYLHGAGPHELYSGCNEFVLRHVKAKEKVTWVHCDYEQYQGNTKYNKKIASQFDKIIACSKSVERVLVESFASDGFNVSNKTDTVYNIVNADELKELAQEYDPYTDVPEGTKKLLTVARLSEEKGIPQAIKSFIKHYPRAKNQQVRWYIVGDGTLKSELNKLIKENNLENVIYLVGEKKNPYPYFKGANALLVTSLHEAAPMVFNEAEVFNLPVLTTTTTSAVELVQNKYKGVIFANIDNLIAYALLKGKII